MDDVITLVTISKLTNEEAAVLAAYDDRIAMLGAAIKETRSLYYASRAGILRTILITQKRKLRKLKRLRRKLLIHGL